MEQDVEQILFDKNELNEICDRLAAQITETYRDSGRELVFIVVLKGSMFFASDLLSRIPLACEIEFMKVSSYGSATETSGNLQIHLDLKRDVRDADVVVLEDIVDSGRTLSKLTALLSDRGANSVRCCTLLDKPERRQVAFDADYVGAEIPDAFVIGYGLDYAETYRNLPYVGILKPTVYTTSDES
ncbi:MAG: hypoxanthine phosphoribosyltransferase [Clostridia bacterium]|nr:hypoxanthine phosphoribosyltransferase [Clostridia bacterium]